MFGFVTDLILREIEDRECLKEKAEDVSQKDKKKKMCTLFSGKASAIAIPPLASIMLSARLSVMRVYVRKPKKSKRKIIIKNVHLVVSKSNSQCFTSFTVNRIR
jgi:hypothetical protein